MKKAILVIILAIITGIGFSILIFKKYEEQEAASEARKVYFVQQGVYSNYNNMIKNTEKLAGFTYEKVDDKYYVYVCFTLEKDNLLKIQNYFKSLNYSTYIKERTLNDIRLLNVLNEYDYLLNAISKEESVKNLCKQLVRKYEEYK